MRSGCCHCTWCEHSRAGEFWVRDGELAHYQCACCHLFYSHEIVSLEDGGRIELPSEEFEEGGRE